MDIDDDENDNLKYKEKDYWNDRFKLEDKYDWLATY